MAKQDYHIIGGNRPLRDIKVKRPKKRYGCEGYAVYQYIQNEIYRVEGCYIRFTDDQLLMFPNTGALKSNG